VDSLDKDSMHSVVEGKESKGGWAAFPREVGVERDFHVTCASTAGDVDYLSELLNSCKAGSND
jgi:hypothetical protein